MNISDYLHDKKIIKFWSETEKGITVSDTKVYSYIMECTFDELREYLNNRNEEEDKHFCNCKLKCSKIRWRLPKETEIIDNLALNYFKQDVLDFWHNQYLWTEESLYTSLENFIKCIKITDNGEIMEDYAHRDRKGNVFLVGEVIWKI